MAARPERGAPAAARHVEAAAEQLVNAGELEREMMEAAFLADVEQEQVVMVVRGAAAQEVRASRVAVARDEAEALGVERHDLVDVSSIMNTVCVISSGVADLKNCAARVDAIGPARRVELELRRHDRLALRDAERDAEAQRIGRVHGAVGVDAHGAVALELGGDGAEIRGRLHAENRFALRRAGLDRLR